MSAESQENGMRWPQELPVIAAETFGASVGQLALQLGRQCVAGEHLIIGDLVERAGAEADLIDGAKACIGMMSRGLPLTLGLAARHLGRRHVGAIAPLGAVRRLLHDNVDTILARGRHPPEAFDAPLVSAGGAQVAVQKECAVDTLTRTQVLRARLPRVHRRRRRRELSGVIVSVGGIGGI